MGAFPKMRQRTQKSDFVMPKCTWHRQVRSVKAEIQNGLSGVDEVAGGEDSLETHFFIRRHSVP